MTSSIENQNFDPTVGRDIGVTSTSRVLTEIRSGRRLEKIAASVESFLENQIARIEKALAEVEQAAENDRIVQKILADFEDEKAAWEQERQAEIERLSRAGEDLIAAWDKLEAEKKAWLDGRDH